MSICDAPSPSSSSHNPELAAGATLKRSSSSSHTAVSPSNRPRKAPRLLTTTSMAPPLRRTDTYIALPDCQNASPMPSSCAVDSAQPVPKNRSLLQYKEQRQRQKNLLRSRLDSGAPLSSAADSLLFPPDPFLAPPSLSLSTSSSTASRTPPQPVVAPVPLYAAPRSPSLSSPSPSSSSSSSPSSFRTTSPLSPSPSIMPARPNFPRSKVEPDLYRKAITTRMRSSPEGQKILHMGPRLAISIMAATKELERIVAAQSEREWEREQRDREGDVVMEDVGGNPVLSNSWVLVPGEDWEMIDCGA